MATSAPPVVVTKPKITSDFKRNFYSVYRPIVISLTTIDTDVAFLRAELFEDAMPGTGGWNSTGILMNAYKDVERGTYSFNVMEYCRPYVSQDLCITFAWLGMILPGYYETRGFRLEIWPVRYSSISVGAVYDDMTATVTSMSFIGVGANTNEMESTDVLDRFVWLDRYCLHKNSDQATNTALPLTNMPYHTGVHNQGYSLNQANPARLGHSVDMLDNHTPSIYYLNGRANHNVLFIATRHKTDGTVTNFQMLQINYGAPMDVQMQRLPVHPVQLAAFVDMHSGAAWGAIIDATGNLNCSGVYLCMTSGGLFTSTNYWSERKTPTGTPTTRWQVINFTDELKGLGPKVCTKTRFHFKNSLGGYDWFNSYGTISKSVAVSGSKYERFRPEGSMRGSRGTKELWTKRTDTWTVMSHPISDVDAKWLEELITSPSVWVEEEIKHLEQGQKSGFLRQLIGVNIVPGSYEIYNTENNINYIEFKYTLSNARTTQRG